MPYGDKPFGIRDIKVTNIGGTVQADMPAAQQMTFRPTFITGEMRGDDATQAIVAFIDKYEWQLGAGGISLDVLAIITGQAVSTSGSSPNEVKTWNGAAGDAMPYFKIYGKSLGENTTDDVHVKLYKCKVMSMEGALQDGQFYVTQANGIAIDGGSGIIDIVQHETAASLPAS